MNAVTSAAARRLFSWGARCVVRPGRHEDATAAPAGVPNYQPGAKTVMLPPYKADRGTLARNNSSCEKCSVWLRHGKITVTKESCEFPTRVERVVSNHLSASWSRWTSG